MIVVHKGLEHIVIDVHPLVSGVQAPSPYVAIQAFGSLDMVLAHINNIIIPKAPSGFREGDFSLCYDGGDVYVCDGFGEAILKIDRSGRYSPMYYGGNNPSVTTNMAGKIAEM